jgi:glycosyltransferase involved in cell wall biosynthesis
VRIIHLSYAIPQPQYSDPVKWLARVSFITGIFESEAKLNEVHAFFHIQHQGTLLKNGVSYHFTNLARWQLFFPVLFHRELRRLAPEVVIVHGLIFPFQVLMLRAMLGSSTTIILQHHAEKPFRDVRQYLQRWADRYISAYLFSSVDLGRRWYDRHQISRIEKIKEIMGTSSIFRAMDRRQAQQVTHVNVRRSFLWVGGLDKNKDPFTVINAFCKFAKSNSGVKLYMIYQSSQLLEEVKNLVRELNASNEVILVGTVEHAQLQFWYNSAEFIISSSHYEGSGIAVCEALSCGCIPILTDIPSFRMMTGRGQIGFLYPAGDSNALFQILNVCVVMDVTSEKQKVVSHFNQELSFEANARKIQHVIEAVR